MTSGSRWVTFGGEIVAIRTFKNLSGCASSISAVLFSGTMVVKWDPMRGGSSLQVILTPSTSG